MRVPIMSVSGSTIANPEESMYPGGVSFAADLTDHFPARTVLAQLSGGSTQESMHCKPLIPSTPTWLRYLNSNPPTVSNGQNLWRQMNQAEQQQFLQLEDAWQRDFSASVDQPDCPMAQATDEWVTWMKINPGVRFLVYWNSPPAFPGKNTLEVPLPYKLAWFGGLQGVFHGSGEGSDSEAKYFNDRYNANRAQMQALLLQIEQRIRTANAAAVTQPVQPGTGAPATPASMPTPTPMSKPKLPPCTTADTHGNRWRLGLCESPPSGDVTGEAKPPTQSTILPTQFTQGGEQSATTPTSSTLTPRPAFDLQSVMPIIIIGLILYLMQKGKL